MVFVGDKKYACETCIKGHRSSSCKHTDRPLFEIKKKGRPVTQCEHCRELRKTKQVHVKCSCESKDDADEASGYNGGGKKGPVSAAFPSGLPEALEASAALQQLSSVSPSGRNSPGTPASTCSCKMGGSCNCCTPRLSKKQGKERIASRADDVTTQHAGEVVNRPAGLAAIANSGHHRPVLPRPSPQRQSSPSGPVHDPSQPVNAHSNRHQSHSDHFFSPYGRAYDHVHGADVVSPQPTLPPSVSESIIASSVYSSSEELYASPQRGDTAERQPAWSDASSPALPDFVPSLCGCGDNCACPGCVVHRGSAAQPLPNMCTNPNECTACFECNFFTSPANLPPGTPLSDFTDTQYQSIDEWVRQLGTAAGFDAIEEPSTLPPDTAPSPVAPPYVPDQRDVRYDPALWQTYALWGSLQGQSAAQSECCGGKCHCAAGMCTCSADCCGCCTGCQCPECDHLDDAARGTSGSKTLTFAESDIRDPCCSGRSHPPSQPQAGPSGSLLRKLGAEASGSQLRKDTYKRGTSLTIPRTTSRASSNSSQVSSHHSRSSLSSHGSAQARVAPRDTASVQPCCNSMRVGTSSPQPSSLNRAPTAADQRRTLKDSYDFIL